MRKAILTRKAISTGFSELVIFKERIIRRRYSLYYNHTAYNYNE